MNENLKDWACSFSGCDGGDPKADIWLCGIEWGYSNSKDKEREKYYKEGLPEEIKNGEVKNPNNEFNWEESLEYTYGRSFAKLYKAINNNKVEDYKSVNDNEKLFRLNLYPITFTSTDSNLWENHQLDKITGFKNKYLFNTWCFFNRFAFFTKLRKKHKPKLIICTGVDYLRDYLMCFNGSENLNEMNTDIISPISEANKYDRTYYWVKIDETLLIIIPFFSGRYGLNSNHLLQEMGGKIKKLMENV